MNFRTLEYVVAVADLGHFGRAAERCQVSQPTLSLQIRSLESQLGVELFERTVHPVQLTPGGQRLIGLMRNTTTEVRKMKNLAKTLRSSDPAQSSSI